MQLSRYDNFSYLVQSIIKYLILETLLQLFNSIVAVIQHNLIYIFVKFIQWHIYHYIFQLSLFLPKMFQKLHYFPILLS